MNSSPTASHKTRATKSTNQGLMGSLIDALQALPSVGIKTAQRLAYHLLQHDRVAAENLADALAHALSGLGHCERCYAFTEDEMCAVCLSPLRDASLLCVVEMPTDLLMVEQTRCYQGLYFVLMSRLSPLDGLGASSLPLEKLLARAGDGVVEEVILSTNYTTEGEATAYFIAEALRTKGVKVSRLARGLSVGGELEYTDASTLAQALLERKRLA